MELSGQVFVNAPREKVWRALLDAGTLDCCLREANAVQRISDTEFQVGAPVHGRVQITQTPPETLVFQADQGQLRIHLRAESSAMTLLDYVLDAGVSDAGRAQTEIDELLRMFQEEVAGPLEFGASGAAGAQAAAVND